VIHDRHAQPIPPTPAIALLVFGGGAIGMMLELAGARVLAPYFGNSLFVWTSLIGVMLGFMSLGYFLGGRLADRKLDAGNLFWILVGAAAAIALVNSMAAALLPGLAEGEARRSLAVVSAAILFAVPSTLLGMVSPYCIRLRMHAVEDSGATVGTLYAISTVGSIVGTFAAGFWLLAVFGTHDLLVLLAAGLAALALLVVGRTLDWRRIAALALLVALVVLGLAAPVQAEESIDTGYDRYFIREIRDPVSGRPLVLLTRDDKGAESASYADTGEPYRMQYYAYYDMAVAMHGPVERALMIGGGTFSYPRLFVAASPGATIDAVEIDPALRDIGESFFGLRDDSRISIHLEDGRTFLNRASGPYDVVFVDAFKSEQTVPWQLTTREAWKRTYELLDDDGVLVMNVIGSPTDERAAFFGALFATIADVFPHTSAFAVQDAPVGGISNTMIVAAKARDADIVSAALAAEPDLGARVIAGWTPRDGTRLLTDDFAPVDQYLLGF
jgi:predicted membrane-bound spermidine synthase